jgi:hypothetical protein
MEGKQEQMEREVERKKDKREREGNRHEAKRKGIAGKTAYRREREWK